MACPTCDHTMQNLDVTIQRIFWCPRCGTLKNETADFTEIVPPSWMRRLDAVRLESCEVNGVLKVTESERVK